MSRIFSETYVPVASAAPDARRTHAHHPADRVMRFAVYAATVAIPLFFSPFSLDVLEESKQTLLIFLACIGLLAWLWKIAATRRVSFCAGWIHAAVLVFVLGYAAVTIASEDRNASAFGILGQSSTALFTVIAFAVLYFIAANIFRTSTGVYHLMFAFLASSLVVGLYGLLQMLGWFVFPFDVTHIRAFTTVGSVYSLAMYMAIPLVMSAALVFHGCRDHACLLSQPTFFGRISRWCVWATLAVSFVVLVFADFAAAWGAVLLGTLLTVLLGVARERRNLGKPVQFLVPAILTGVSLILIFFRTPFHLGFPGEVSPSARASWSVARATLAEHPIFGSGPATWAYDYALYRAHEVNGSPFWTVRFDRGMSSFFTALATTGIFGTMLVLGLFLAFVLAALAHLLREKNEEVWYAYAMVFGGWATVAWVSFFYHYQIPHAWALWLFMAGLSGLMVRRTFVYEPKRSGRRALVGAVIVLSCLVLVAGWTIGERAYADAAFSKAMTLYRQGKPMDAVIPHLARAYTLNPKNDLYARNLSQAHLIQAIGQLATNRSAEERFAAAKIEIAEAMKSGQSAIKLAPGNVDNWANMAVLYQKIAGITRGADEFAIKFYREAHAREPENPMYVAEIGKLFLLRSDAYRQLESVRDSKGRAEAVKNAELNLKQADEVLRRAIQIKTDYLPAHYYLGLVRERQGNLPQAILELESVLQANSKDVGVAFELALLYYRHNEQARAINLLGQIVSADPNNANARWYASAMYEEQGRLDEAIAVLQPLADQMKNNTNIAQKLAALKAARAARRGPSVEPLPEPIKESIRGPGAESLN